MERTKYLKQSTKTNSNLSKISLSEMNEELTSTEQANLLSLQSDIQVRIFNIKNDMYEIGKDLYEAKKILPYGYFIPWIKETFNNEIAYNTARMYMKIYTIFKDHPRSVKYIPSKYLLMITSGKFPSEIVKTLNQNPESIDKYMLEEINEIYTTFKEGKIGESSFIKLAQKQISVGIDLWKGSATHRINTNTRKSFYFGGKDILTRLKSLISIAREMTGIYPPDLKSKEHIEFIKNIDNTILELEKLKVESEGRTGFFRQISTEIGNKYISNV